MKTFFALSFFWLFQTTAFADCKNEPRCMQKTILGFSDTQKNFAKLACEFGKPANKCRTAMAIIIVESTACDFKRSILSTEPLILGEDFGCWGVNINSAMNLTRQGIFPPGRSIVKFKTEAHRMVYMQSRLMDEFYFESFYAMEIFMFWYLSRHNDNSNINLRDACRGFHGGYSAFKWSSTYNPGVSASADRYWKQINTLFVAFRLDNGKAFKFLMEDDNNG